MIFYFSRKRKKFSGNNIYSSFQKCHLGKKCNLNYTFSRKKGYFALARALGKTWGAAPPVPTPLCFCLHKNQEIIYIYIALPIAIGK